MLKVVKTPCSATVKSQHRKTTTSTCHVCDIETKNTSFGIPVCGACRKFFARNRSHFLSFTCLTGRNDCDVSRVASGKCSFKAICRRCRLAKAFSVGLSVGRQLPAKPESRQLEQHQATNEPSCVFNGGTSILDTLLWVESDGLPETRKQPKNSFHSSISSIVSELCFTPKLIDEMNVTPEALVAKLIAALWQFSESITLLPLVAVEGKNITKADYWADIAADYEITSKTVLEFARRLPGLKNLSSFADSVILRNTYAGLKAIAVSAPFLRRSFISCFERSLAGRINLIGLEALDESVGLIESAIEIWQPSTAELAILMAIHVYKGFQGEGFLPPYDVQMAITTLTSLLGDDSNSSQRLSLMNHILSMLNVMSATWEESLKNLSHLEKFPAAFH